MDNLGAIGGPLLAVALVAVVGVRPAIVVLCLERGLGRLIYSVVSPRAAFLYLAGWAIVAAVAFALARPD